MTKERVAMICLGAKSSIDLPSSRRFLHAVVALVVISACTGNPEKPVAPVQQSELARVVPSGSKVVHLDSVDVSKATPTTARTPGPSDSNKQDSNKQIPSLAGLNAGSSYTPAASDLSPEGFNWLHRDLGLIYAGAIYEEGFSGGWRESVLRERRPALESYLQSLRTISRAQFDKWGEPQRLSFLINAYHAHVLKLMIDHDFKGLTDVLLKQAGAVELFSSRYSLEQFIAKELRDKYEDPRIFFALFCFSDRCPELRNSTYNYKNVEAMLSSSTMRFFRNPQKNRVDLDKKTLTLSPLVYRYKDLIERHGQTLSAFIASCLGDEHGSKDAVLMLENGTLKLQ